MININNITIDTTKSSIKSVKIEVIADDGGCHMVVTYVVEVDGLTKRDQFSLHGEEFNTFWSTYSSDSDLLSLISDKSGYDINTDVIFENAQHNNS